MHGLTHSFRCIRDFRTCYSDVLYGTNYRYVKGWIVKGFEVVMGVLESLAATKIVEGLQSFMPTLWITWEICLFWERYKP